MEQNATGTLLDYLIIVRMPLLMSQFFPNT